MTCIRQHYLGDQPSWMTTILGMGWFSTNICSFYTTFFHCIIFMFLLRRFINVVLITKCHSRLLIGDRVHQWQNCDISVYEVYIFHRFRHQCLPLANTLMTVLSPVTRWCRCWAWAKLCSIMSFSATRKRLTGKILRLNNQVKKRFFV